MIDSLSTLQPLMNCDFQLLMMTVVHYNVIRRTRLGAQPEGLSIGACVWVLVQTTSARLICRRAQARLHSISELAWCDVTTGTQVSEELDW